MRAPMLGPARLVAGLLLALLLVACSGEEEPSRDGGGGGSGPTGTSSASGLEIGSEENAEVVNVLGGHEIAVMLAGEEVRVRYAGIEAPFADECRGIEAMTLNEELVGGSEVGLTVVGRAQGQIVADVRTEDDQLVQQELLAAGLARVTSAEGANLAAFRAAEQAAREEAIGIWEDCPILLPGFRAHILTEDLMGPVSIAFAPGGEMLVAEKDGRIRWLDSEGVLQVEPVLDIVEKVHSIGDRGLLSVAVDPAFQDNGYIYALYNVDSEEGEPDENGHLPTFGRISRFHVDDDMRADPASETILVGETAADGPPIRFLSHSGGELVFGPDGRLFASFGEGSDYRRADDGTPLDAEDEAFNEVFPEDEQIGSFRSQSLDSLAGKLLRIDPETGDGLSDNPFWNGDPAAARSKVFALGLRHPFRIAMAPGDELRLIVADVGYLTWEEINLIEAGDNAEWPCREGPGEGTQHLDVPGRAEFCPPAGGMPVDPAFAYHHHDPGSIGFTGRTLIGGDIYQGSNVAPDHEGSYIFGDFTAGFLRSLRIAPDGAVSDSQSLGTGLIGLSELAIHPESGDIYAAIVLKGQILRIAYEP